MDQLEDALADEILVSAPLVALSGLVGALSWTSSCFGLYRSIETLNRPFVAWPSALYCLGLLVGAWLMMRWAASHWQRRRILLSAEAVVRNFGPGQTFYFKRDRVETYLWAVVEKLSRSGDRRSARRAQFLLDSFRRHDTRPTSSSARRAPNDPRVRSQHRVLGTSRIGEESQ